MAQGEFTKEEAQATRDAVSELFEGVARAKKGNFLGHLNDIMLFLNAAERAAPTEAEAKASVKAKEVPGAQPDEGAGDGDCA